MKKIINALLVLVLVFVAGLGIVACNNSTPPPAPPKTFYVQFETYGLCSVDAQTVEENATANKPFPDPTCSTHIFEGWYTDGSFTTEFNFATPITNHTIVYAKWKEIETVYTITFDNNGHGKKVPSQTIEAGTNGKINRPSALTASGWKFLGWSLDKDGANNLLDFETFVPTSSLTVYAQWLRVYVIDFNLNNEEAISITTPASQSVDSGDFVSAPEDPVVYGYDFLGWATSANATEFYDFGTPVTSKFTLYAIWRKNVADTVDGTGIPEYDTNYQAAYGERPDLEGYVIDGIMGEEENWENQNFYTHTLTDAPTISMSISTQFSQKGLYVFVTAKDNGGIYWTGRNWFYQNSHFEIYIARPGLTVHHDKDVKLVKIDSHNLYPSFTHAKAAAKIVEGEVNPVDSSNKFAQMNVEIFITWKELRMDTLDGSIPETVTIDPVYNYKRMPMATFTYKHRTLFANTNSMSSQLPNYLVFDKNGYSKPDAEDAVLGDSSLGIAKTGGWDITNANAENPSVVCEEAGSQNQVIFFKNVSGNYYQFETEIVPNASNLYGKAGVIIYNTEANYSTLQFDVTSATYDATEGWKIAQPRMFTTNKDGGLDIVNMQPIEITNGKLVLKTIFNNGYIFYIVNGTLIHCEMVETLNNRTTPGLIALNSAGVRFINNSCDVLTSSTVTAETSKYAYIINKGKLQSLTMSFSTVGVPTNVSNSATMYYQNAEVSLTAAQKKSVVENGDFSGVRVRQIEKVTAKTAAGVVDITEDFLARAGYGEYQILNLTSDVEYENTVSNVSESELVYISADLFDIKTSKMIESTAEAIIKSSNPRLSHYKMRITGAAMVLVMPKGFDYEIQITATGYRHYNLDKITNLSESINLGSIYMTPNIVGGVATNEDGTMSFASSAATWDMSTESLGYVDMSTPNTSFTPVYFSGPTIHKYQVMELVVANTTDVLANPSYEADPGAGFGFTDKTGTSYIELSKGRIRLLRQDGGWHPEYVAVPGSAGTVNILPGDPYDESTYYYTKLTVIKIGKICYCFVNGEYITSTELYNRGEECAIAIAGHSSYYLSMRYKDYWIKVGDEALEYAKQTIAMNPQLDETCFDFDDNYDPDPTKPIIKFDGLLDVGNGENVGFIGNTVTVSLTEYSYAGLAYVVKLGDKKGILTAEAPSFDFVIDESMRGNVSVSIEYSVAKTVSGKVMLEDGSAAGVVEGEAISDDGKSVVPFTTGEDGSFTIGLPSGIYSIKIYKEAYAVENKKINVNKDVSGLTVTLYKMPIGGKIEGGTYSSTDNMSLGYGYADEGLNISGAYMEANVIEGDSRYAFNEGIMDDFVFEFRYQRKEVPTTGDVINETNPGLGVRLYVGSISETVMFYNTGVRILPANMPNWSDRIELLGLSKNSVKDFNKTVDFKIIRRNNVFFMYSKSAEETEYELIYTFESKSGFGAAEVYLMNTNTAGRPNRFFAWNINVQPFTNENLPQEIKRNVAITNLTPTLGSYSVIADTAMNGNERVYAMGDEITLGLNAVDGAIPAYVTVNGEYATISRNRVSFDVRSEDINVEIKFEPVPQQVTAKLKVDVVNNAVIGEVSTVDVYAKIEDGRIYEFRNLAIDSDGYVTLSIREGEFDIWAESEFVTSKYTHVVIDGNTQSLGTVKLDVLKVGSTTVNGKLVAFSVAPGEDNLHSDGAYNAPARSQQHVWVPATKISGDFVFSSTIILSGNPNSPYYAKDNCTGISFTDGTNRFVIQFWGKGFRVFNGNYNNKIGMIQPKYNGADFFDPNTMADVEHTITVARKGTTLKVYVDETYFMTLDSKGYSIINEYNSVYVSAEQVRSVAELLVSVFGGDANKEFVAGYSTCIDTSLSGDLNKAGFKNTTMTNDPDQVAKYFN